jgi:hypothetical protein
MPTEQLANNALTTLAAAIDADDTTLTVASHAAFPATAQFRVLIHSELLLVTAGAGSATWTVTRGIEGTTPAPHAIGSSIAHVLTAGALDAFVHAPTGVTAGSYSSANITVGSDGRITAASSSTPNWSSPADVPLSGLRFRYLNWDLFCIDQNRWRQVGYGADFAAQGRNRTSSTIEISNDIGTAWVTWTIQVDAYYVRLVATSGETFVATAPPGYNGA